MSKPTRGKENAVTTESADDGSQWAWAENVGWINGEPIGDSTFDRRVP